MSDNKLTAKDFLEKFRPANIDERTQIVVDAGEQLSNSQLKIFKRQIKSIEADEKNKTEKPATGDPIAKTDDEDDDDESSDDDDGEKATPATSAKKAAGTSKIKAIAVTDAEVLSFWNELESMTGDNLLSEQVAEDFRYVGFDPNLIMKSIIIRGKEAKRTKDQILSDIAAMCTMAIIKGSVTENNLKKMSDAGKHTYTKFESMYGLKKGGSRGEDPSTITIARVGAAFPGSMMRILEKRPDLAKKFSGPFGSKILPPYLRHQSAAACIPETLTEPVKNFLLGMIVAFTSDQSKTISKSKDKPDEIYDRQENFITQTHSASFPSEGVRKQIFKSWTLSADFDKLKAVSDNIIRHVKTFDPISKEDLVAGLTGL